MTAGSVSENDDLDDDDADSRRGAMGSLAEGNETDSGSISSGAPSSTPDDPCSTPSTAAESPTDGRNCVDNFYCWCPLMIL